MIKITYLEDGICVEHLPKSAEVWKADRILLSLRAGISVYAESGIGSLVFPISPLYLEGLAKLAETELIYISPCDEDYVEVSLLGMWVAESEESEEGIFVCNLSCDNEYLLSRLWQESLLETSAVSE
jgi:hypothetical protein